MLFVALEKKRQREAKLTDKRTQARKRARHTAGWRRWDDRAYQTVTGEVVDAYEEADPLTARLVAWLSTEDRSLLARLPRELIIMLHAYLDHGDTKRVRICTLRSWACRGTYSLVSQCDLFRIREYALEAHCIAFSFAPDPEALQRAERAIAAAGGSKSALEFTHANPRLRAFAFDLKAARGEPSRFAHSKQPEGLWIVTTYSRTQKPPLEERISLMRLREDRAEAYLFRESGLLTAEIQEMWHHDVDVIVCERIGRKPDSRWKVVGGYSCTPGEKLDLVFVYGRESNKK